MIKWLKYKIHDYFGFSKAETNGVVILLFLIITFLLFPQTLRFYDKHKVSDEANYEEDMALLDSMMGLLEAKNLLMPEQSQATSKHFPSQLVADKASLDNKTNKHTSNKKIMQPFDINSADTTQLKQISGIGVTLAKRIVKYRDKLGGFISKDQYKEVYGLQEAVIERLAKYTYIVPAFKPRKMNINTYHFKALVSHPYILYKHAKNIIAYREQHGNFAAVEDLLALPLIDKDDLEKMKPYLAVE
ncbi:MAG: helix-hairpin-helix domain-containing protein [Cytophagales bacterium]|nr:helix-hairpin-helix domain-containing protein [Cytophagales bacterium]